MGLRGSTAVDRVTIGTPVGTIAVGLSDSTRSGGTFTMGGLPPGRYNLTVQGRMSRWIVSALPVALVAVISVINPRYMHPLVVHTAGKVLLVIAALLVIAGSYAIKKIVDIEV